MENQRKQTKVSTINLSLRNRAFIVGKKKKSERKSGVGKGRKLREIYIIRVHANTHTLTSIAQ